MTGCSGVSGNEGPKALEGRQQLGIGSSLKPPPRKSSSRRQGPVVKCRSTMCSWTSSILGKQNASREVHYCPREQCVQLDLVRSSSVATASEENGIMCLAHLGELQKQKQCSSPHTAAGSLLCTCTCTNHKSQGK
eukprot:1151996-Pelagomonas_calceolata.AAC.4